MGDFSSLDVYKFISHFGTHQEFVEFAKSFLGISDRQINDISLDYRDSVREQKYQIVRLWKRKLGRVATMYLLWEKRDTFRKQSYDEEDADFEDSLRTSRFQSSNMASGQNTEPAHCAVGSTPPLQQSHQISEPIQGGEDDKTRGSAPTGEGNQVPGDQSLSNNLLDQLRAISLGQDKGYCDKVENLTVKVCSPDTLEDIDRKIKAGDAYEIAKSGYRGYVLILNNNFDGDDERHGAQQDVENLRKVFESKEFGSKVNVLQDLPACEIYDAFDEIATWEGIKNYDFLAVFFMSHGTLKIGEDSLKGNDGEPVYVNKVLSKFDNSSCPFLHNKPKLFFFQFCRGRNIDGGVSCNDTENEPAESMRVHETVQCDGSKLPQASDMFLSFATLKGYEAYRDCDHGSWFITAIANIFAEFAHKEHVADLMTKVRLAVKEKSGYIEIRHEGKTGYVPCREMSESLNRLTKKLYLMPTNMCCDPLDE